MRIHVGGVMVCCAALCAASGIGYHDYSLGFVALLLATFGGYLWGLDTTININVRESAQERKS